MIIVFIFSLYQTTHSIFTLKRVNKGRGHLEYIQEGSNGFLSLPFGIQGLYIYLIGVFLPFIYLGLYGRGSGCNNTQWKYWILFLYLLLSLFIAYIWFPINQVGSMWCYLSIGFIFLVWFFGIFNC